MAAEAALELEQVRRESEQERREAAEQSAVKWQTQAERLTLLLTDQRETQTAPSRPLWKRIFGRHD